MSIKSTGKLETKSMAELVEIYNSTVTSSARIKKFRDKETAVRRTLEALAAAQKNSPVGNSPRARRGKKPLPAKGEGSGRKRKPFNLEPASEIKSHRPGTKRALLITMLQGSGSTFQEVMDGIAWDQRTAYEGIKLLNRHLGWGVVERENGKITITKKS